MSYKIIEPAREILVDATYDVAVVGGGIGGVSAALAAARAGVRVVLIEKMFGLGGLATLGNVVKYLPLCDGRGNQVMGGIAEELLRLSEQDIHQTDVLAGFIPVPDCWDAGGDVEERKSKRLFSSFNPASFQLYMEDVLEQSGVTLMYDTRLCNVLADNRKIHHLIVENKSGRLAIAAKSVVDASGDADVCHLLNCETELFPNNVLAAWHYLVRNGRLKLQPMSRRYDKEHGRGTRAEAPFFNGVDHKELTEHVLQSRKELLKNLATLRQESPEDAIYPINLPSIPDIRMSRCLKNTFAMSEADMHTWTDDCVGLTGDWRRRGPVYPIPLRALRADTCANLFTAGRCISADKTVCDVTRAIQTCAVSGEASGTASAMQVKHNFWAELPIAELQKALLTNGVILDRELVQEKLKMCAVS